MKGVIIATFGVLGFVVASIAYGLPVCSVLDVLGVELEACGEAGEPGAEVLP